MILDAIVQEVNWRSLLVREIGSRNEILVNNVFNAQNFSRGNCVRIHYTGQMTLSIPPQISAISVENIECDPERPSSPSRPSEMTAIVLQRRRNELLTRNLSNNHEIIVRTPHADHFCIGQRLIVTYDSILMNNPPEVEAISIRSIC